MSALHDNDIRERLVALSRLLDPREAGSLFDVRVPNSNKRDEAVLIGQAVEAAFHVAEEFFVDVHRIAAALERIAFDETK